MPSPDEARLSVDAKCIARPQRCSAAPDCDDARNVAENVGLEASRNPDDCAQYEIEGVAGCVL